MKVSLESRNKVDLPICRQIQVLEKKKGILKAFFTRGSQISPAGARACSRQRRRRADKRRATRPGLQRGRLRRLRVSTSISLHSDSPTPAAACIFDCVPHCHAGRARSRKVAHKGLATRHGLLRERLRHPRVGIIMPVRSDTKTPVAACITDCAPHFCCQRPCAVFSAQEAGDQARAAQGASAAPTRR